MQAGATGCNRARRPAPIVLCCLFFFIARKHGPRSRRLMKTQQHRRKARSSASVPVFPIRVSQSHVLPRVCSATLFPIPPHGRRVGERVVCLENVTYHARHERRSCTRREKRVEREPENWVHTSTTCVQKKCGLLVVDTGRRGMRSNMIDGVRKKKTRVRSRACCTRRATDSLIRFDAGE